MDRMPLSNARTMGRTILCGSFDIVSSLVQGFFRAANPIDRKIPNTLPSEIAEIPDRLDLTCQDASVCRKHSNGALNEMRTEEMETTRKEFL
jgi:hypothetical protein